MIVGVGIDLIETERVARALDRWGERLVAQAHGRGGGLAPPGRRRRPRARPRPRHRGQGGGEQGPGHGLVARACAGATWSWTSARPWPCGWKAGRCAWARRLGSAGQTRAALEVRGDLVIGQVRLLS